MSFWDDKHVFVTGASSGLGLACAEFASARGAHVTLAARDAGRLEAAEMAVQSQRLRPTQRVLALPCDVSDRAQVQDSVRDAVAASGPVDVLLTCAGYCEPRPFSEMPIEDFVRQIEVDLLGTVYPVHAVVDSMIERGKGHIGLVSSMAGFIAVYGYSAYSAAKFGVTGFAEVLRSELRPHGISVTLACPPNMDTPGYELEVRTQPEETAAINGMAKTVAPSVAAEQFLKGVERRKFLVLHGVSNRLLYRVEGLWPELFYRVFDHTIASVQRKEAQAHVSL